LVKVVAELVELMEMNMVKVDHKTNVELAEQLVMVSKAW
jgi:hypothetical protein